jgi:hypothetical protein
MEKPASSQFSRRQFLRGAGACIALPAFVSLQPASLKAQQSADRLLATTATGAPLRTAFVFFPNGAIPSRWWPQGGGNDFEFSQTLAPLEAHRDHVQILGGLDHECAESGRDGAGDHARGNSVFLTGVRLNKSSTVIRAGVSIDQIIARQVRHLTRFASLELTCDARRKTSGCDSGYSCAYQHNLSWSSETTPMAPESNPRHVFERLFGAGSPGERTANLQRRRETQRSLLDFVLEDARAMQGRLGARDDEKLDQYLTGVREIEQRIETAERFGDPQLPGVETPDGIPNSYEEHVRLMYDMLLLAFQTDSTRVATLLLAHDGSNRSFEDIGVVEGHHDLSHHQYKQDRIDKVAEIDRWYVQQFAYFLNKLRETKDIDGNSLLHNSMILYGSGNADGNRHTHSNLPLILAGSAGGTLTAARYTHHRSQPLCNLFLTMADRVGANNLERFGDSTGHLSNV